MSKLSTVATGREVDLYSFGGQFPKGLLTNLSASSFFHTAVVCPTHCELDLTAPNSTNNAMI